MRIIEGAFQRLLCGFFQQRGPPHLCEIKIMFLKCFQVLSLASYCDPDPHGRRDLDPDVFVGKCTSLKEDIYNMAPSIVLAALLSQNDLFSYSKGLN